MEDKLSEDWEKKYEETIRKSSLWKNVLEKMKTRLSESKLCNQFLGPAERLWLYGNVLLPEVDQDFIWSIDHHLDLLVDILAS